MEEVIQGGEQPSGSEGKRHRLDEELRRLRQAEGDLKLSNTRLKNVLDYSGIGVWEWDFVSETLFWDEQMHRIYGVEPSEFRGMHEDWSDRVHPDDLERALAQKPIEIGKANVRVNADVSAPKGGTHAYEFRIVRPNGEIRHLFTNVYVENGEDGKPSRAIGLNMDVTESREAELALRESETKFQRIAEHVPGMVYRYIVHPDGTDELAFVSSGSREVFELEPDEAIKGMAQIWERIHEDDREWVGKEIAASAESLSPFLAEYRLRLPKKGVRWAQSYSQPFRDSNGAVIWDGVMLDHTERKQSQLALQEAQDLLQRMTENVPGMIYRFVQRSDGSQAAEYVSSKCRDLFEVEPEEVLEDVQKLFAYIHPEDIERTLESIQHSSEALSHYKAEYRVILPLQGLRWRQAIGQPTRVENGDTVWDGVVIDVTHRKQAEIQLQHVNEELARATKMKDGFLATMSHELRTPLNAIMGMTDGLQDGVFGPVTEKQLRGFEIIQQSGSHLLELINEVLDLAKIESGSLQLEVSAVDIAELCGSSVQMFAQQAEKKNIDLNLNLPSNVPEFEADEKRLRQVIVNLLSNAIKFTPDGGQVTIDVARLVTGEHAGSLRISVSDTGIGIEKSDLASLFEPFFQVDSSLSRNYSGSGLGLSLVERFVELHGGSVRVSSEPGVGSCFIVDLPFRIMPHPEASGGECSQGIKPTRAQYNQTRTHTILLAEDNDNIAEAMTGYLEDIGFQIYRAIDGQSAIDLARQHKLDLILMDIQMPNLDGFAAIEEIRQLENNRTTPIVATTGLAMAGDANRCKVAGADEYLSKPFRMPQLMEVVDRMLNRATTPRLK